MSTSYYRLKPPITSLRLEEGPSHDLLSVFENHALAGVLTLSKGAGRQIAWFFHQEESSPEGDAIHTWWGGDASGLQLTERVPLHGSDILISEYGELTTVAALRALRGKNESPP